MKNLGISYNPSYLCMSVRARVHAICRNSTLQALTTALAIKLKSHRTNEVRCVGNCAVVMVVVMVVVVVVVVVVMAAAVVVVVVVCQVVVMVVVGGWWMVGGGGGGGGGGGDANVAQN